VRVSERLVNGFMHWGRGPPSIFAKFGGLVMDVIHGEFVACLTWDPCSCDLVDNISSCLAHVLL